MSAAGAPHKVVNAWSVKSDIHRGHVGSCVGRLACPDQAQLRERYAVHDRRKWSHEGIDPLAGVFIGARTRHPAGVRPRRIQPPPESPIRPRSGGVIRNTGADP